MVTTTVDTRVRDRSGAYVTDMVRGRRCSCTHSAEEAARRLGKKVFGAGFVRVEQLEVAEPEFGETAWRIYGVEAA